MADVKLAYVTWRDACSEEASTPGIAVKPRLVELREIGFLLNENEEAVVIGMELEPDGGDCEPGRWRLHIPRVAIVSMKVVELEQAFSTEKRKRARNG